MTCSAVKYNLVSTRAILNGKKLFLYTVFPKKACGHTDCLAHMLDSCFPWDPLGHTTFVVYRVFYLYDFPNTFCVMWLCGSLVCLWTILILSLIRVGTGVGGGATLCAANEKVSGHTRVACPAGATNAAGDDASGADTNCDGLVCDFPSSGSNVFWCDVGETAGGDFQGSQRNGGRTPSGGTGPSDGPNGGSYVFTSSSKPGWYYGINFWYHMYGSTMGTLSVQTVGASGVWSTVWSLSGQQHSSSSEIWSRATVPPFATPTGRVRFKGQKGSAYTSDMAISNVELLFVPDVDEYADGTHNCAAGYTCSHTAGSFTCNGELTYIKQLAHGYKEAGVALVFIKAFVPRRRQTACTKDLPVRGLCCAFFGLGSGFDAVRGGGHQ